MTADNIRIGMGHGSLMGRIDGFFLGLGLGVNPYSLRRARMRELIALESKSDADLARMGLTRDQIVPHVFRDLLAG
ncbi:hypothetical protein [Salipiger mucosus]|uniref:DUF1127 domain-containing protein n=1 Tax=Salipiger mucosus DSM 16094 TaxID=1123237 RepID=S9Q4I3_9RHOB|nr:hypothetical protein [Salipiger mucosus]EPX76246.1 hypothetical protein Salmuc_04547 [Salipiger mucosus DSM 16094]